MKKVVHLFASQRVNRKARTDNEEVFREKVTLITNKQMSVGTLADFARLVKDMGICGIVIGDKKVIIKAKQTSIVGSDGIPIALFDTDGKKLNAELIDAINIVTQALQAGTIKAGDAIIDNLKVTNADVSGKITATNGTVGNMVINNDSIGKIENSDGVVITKDSITCSRSDLYFTGDNKVVVSTQGDNLIYIQRKQVPTLNTFSLSPIVKIASKVGAIGTSAFQTQGTAVEIEGNVNIPEGNIYMENGSLIGSVRKTVYDINSNTDLDKGNYESGMILICNNSSDISLRLPSTNAYRGDFFTMIKTGTGKVNVYGESYIPCRGGWREGNGWTASTRYEHTHFLFDGYTWYSECTLDT